MAVELIPVTLACLMQVAANSAAVAQSAGTPEIAVPPHLLATILSVEGGEVGKWSPNSNGTYDIGPGQINTIWLPELARAYGRTEQAVAAALTYDGCFNVAVSAWILQKNIREMGGVWQGVGAYHSRTPQRGASYAIRVAGRAMECFGPDVFGKGAPLAPACRIPSLTATGEQPAAQSAQTVGAQVAAAPAIPRPAGRSGAFVMPMADGRVVQLDEAQLRELAVGLDRQAREQARQQVPVSLPAAGQPEAATAAVAAPETQVAQASQAPAPVPEFGNSGPLFGSMHTFR